MEQKQVTNPWLALASIAMVSYAGGVLQASWEGKDAQTALQHALFPAALAVFGWIYLKSPFARIAAEATREEGSLATTKETENLPGGGVKETETVLSRNVKTTTPVAPPVAEKP